MSLDLDRINAELGDDAEKLIEWALSLNEKAIVTTNFRPFEAVILHMLTRVKPDIQVVWMDNGYNTETTYKYVDEISKLLHLNLLTYLPKRSRAHREALEGSVPALDDPKHEAFTAEVKLEPFERALRETAPKVWFTALRATDTAVRAEMDAVSINPDGLIKVAPLLKWTSKDLWEYMQKHNLPDNEDYFDPTKGEEHRECGLHLSH
ncbi:MULTISPECIES: phosphoadenosine phosphosulfate reductase family protein [unclassified Acinetobacter]|uniref:phosphoadenosine phosphosulfate reductase domain-containing protein n=1 Tax=unclassified Acinetobacter TaxID=196816 RepID=UPI00190C80E2|nr:MULTISPECIES: phosphoadenosine phosphosulfate reductase family protein [unclassified Acinetobacter]MBK0064336.1 phosphoadenosine phosphosulfate reductase family protein [Acinetobacter sp. S55]MBK0067857.1 phosphoadenosine phosphosulfate reductase family protein [Acinetobacter sp. S54]